MSESAEATVLVSDLVLAKIAAQASIAVPGVVRLAPSITRVVKSALTRAAKSITNREDDRAEPGDADPGAVEVDRVSGPEVVLTVRIIAGGDPPVLVTANAVQLAVRKAVLQIAALAAEVVVLVVDTEPTGVVPTAEYVATARA